MTRLIYYLFSVCKYSELFCSFLLCQDFLPVLDVDAWLRYLVDFAALEVEEGILPVRDRGHGDACYNL